MKPLQALFASLAGIAALSLSAASLADPAVSDTTSAAVQQRALEPSSIETMQRALDAHLHLWTSNDSAHYPYEFLLADGVVYEFPYATLPSLRRMEGKAQIAGHLREEAQRATDWKFSDVKLYSTLLPNVFFASFNATAVMRETGQPYRQTYMLRVTMDGDRIANLLVLWDERAAATAQVGANSN